MPTALPPTICPNCLQEIPIEDINISENLAACRNCSELFKLSDLTLTPSNDRLPPTIPKYLSVQMTPEGAQVLTLKNPNKLIFFLIPFTCIWSGVSLSGIYGSMLVKGEFNPTNAIFGLPFLFGTIILAIVIFSCVATTQFIINRQQDFRYELKFLGFGITKTRKLPQKMTISIEEIQRNRKTIRQLVIRPAEEKPIKIRTWMWSNDVLNYVVIWLRNNCR